MILLSLVITVILINVIICGEGLEEVDSWLEDLVGLRLWFGSLSEGSWKRLRLAEAGLT